MRSKRLVSIVLAHGVHESGAKSDDYLVERLHQVTKCHTKPALRFLAFPRRCWFNEKPKVAKPAVWKREHFDLIRRFTTLSISEIELVDDFLLFASDRPTQNYIRAFTLCERVNLFHSDKRDETCYQTFYCKRERQGPFRMANFQQNTRCIMHCPKTAASALTITQRATNIPISCDAAGVCDGFPCRELFFVVVNSQSGGGCRGKLRKGGAKTDKSAKTLDFHQLYSMKIITKLT